MNDINYILLERFKTRLTKHDVMHQNAAGRDQGTRISRV